MNREEIEAVLAQTDFVRSLARSLVIDESRADDISQQALLAAIESRLPTERPLRAWFSGVVRNLTKLGFRRDRSRLKREQLATWPDKNLSASEEAELKEVRRTIVEAVLELEEPYRSAIELRYFGELKSREVADKLNIPVETVRTRLKRGLAKLRQKLDKEFGDRGAWCLALAPLAGLKVGMKAASIGVAASTVSGGLIMATKVKVGIAAVVVLGVSLVLWQTWPEETENNVSALASVGDREKPPRRVSHGSESEQEENDIIPIAPKTKEYTLWGEVLEEKTGAPIENAKVVVNKLPFQEEIDGIQIPTDAEGHFIVRYSVGEKYKVTGFDIGVSMEGYIDLISYRPILDDHDNKDCGSLYLTKDREYTIRILNERGSPISGAVAQFYMYFQTVPFMQEISNEEGYIYVRSQDLSNPSLRRMVGLRVTARAMADLYCVSKYDRDGDEDSPFPVELVMEPEGSRLGRVVECESGAGIAGAVISISSEESRVVKPLGNLRITTDELGCFQMPTITLLDEKYARLRVLAVGYRPVRGNHERFPTEIEMKKTGNLASCCLVDSETGQPLPNVEFHLNRNALKLSSDDYGYFKYDRDGLDWLNVCTTDKSMLFIGEPRLNNDQEGVYIIPLQNIFTNRLEITVLDDMSRPVAWAKVRVRFHQAFNTDRFTDTNGVAVLDETFMGSTKAHIEITHKNFCTYRSELIDLKSLAEEEADGKKLSMSFHISRGVRFQHIYVCDGSGLPKSGQPVRADLRDTEGNKIELYGTTDEDGRCALTFPPFKTGRLYLHKRPDAGAYVDYETVQGREPISIVVNEDPSQDYVVAGRVVDEAGSPVKGINVKVLNEVGRTRLGSIRTEADGKFKVPVFKDRLYVISCGLIMRKGVVYIADEQSGVAAGCNLTIVMEKWKGAKIDFYDVWERELLSTQPFEIWLENDNGSKIEAIRIVNEIWNAMFLGIPDGTMKAVIETKGGKKYQSGFFNVEDGKCPERILIRT